MYNKEKIFQTFNAITEESKSIKPYLIICQPRRSLKEVPAQNFEGYMGLHIDMCGYSHAFCNIGGEKVDVARNHLFNLAIESDAKYMLFAGEDTVIPYDGFLKLHDTAEKNPDAMIVGVYYIKLSTPMIHVKDGDYIHPANVDPGQLLDTWSCGLDCALIPIKILKEMKELDPENPFCCIGGPDIIPNIPFIGEDTYFTYRLRKEGYKILCNTDVQCLHCDLESGKYTAHPSVDLINYHTNFPMTEELTMQDKEFIDKRYVRELEK